ncbi:putative transcription factor YjjQ [compost metagenome]
MALERFCRHPWVALHAGAIWKCRQCRISALSSCEKKVLKLMSTGMSACTIAGMLHRSQKTISAHKRSAMRKLNVRKNTELNKMLLNQMGLN